MPNTSSSVPHLLSSSMHSILRSRRPSTCLSGSGSQTGGASGLWNQFGSGMVRQIVNTQHSTVNGRAFPGTNVRQCPSISLSLSLSLFPFFYFTFRPLIFSASHSIHPFSQLLQGNRQMPKFSSKLTKDTILPRPGLSLSISGVIIGTDRQSCRQTENEAILFTD